MPLSVAARLGPYEVLGPLGAGGMGEVYRARDTRLDRVVALKVLPAELASSPERRARFEREAKAVSALNHPHICTLHDVGRHDGMDYLVLEYIEGETLAERLKRGPLPLDQVLRYGTEIADALDRAHRHGIVHRDLKPGNVMLTKSGTKLLDFGLAKLRATDSKPAGSTFSGLETIEKPGKEPLTAEGRLLGTFQYMAPEQVEGGEADARTDIFALGSVLYEMTTGKRAFEGKSATSLVAAILERDPPSMTTFRPLTPAALDRLVRKCLAKDPDERWQSAADLASELQWVQDVAPAALESRRREQRGWWVAAAMAIITAAAIVTSIVSPSRRWEESRSAEPIVSSILLPEGVAWDNRWGVALSPDGKHLAFSAITPDGKQLLWLESMQTGEARALPDTDGAWRPFWSPDGRVIGFFARGKLKKVAASGGTPQTICSVGAAGLAGSWGIDDTILLNSQQAPVILRVPASGGTPSEVTRLDPSRGEVRHRFPEFLPDGRHFVYVVSGRERGIYLGVLDGGPGRLLVPGVGDIVRYAPPGYLLYSREDGLFAQRLDGDGSDLGRDTFTVAQNAVGPAMTAGRDLVYASRRAPAPAAHLEWKDRSGNTLGRFTDLYWYQGLRLSHDGRQLAVCGQPTSDSEYGLWVYQSAGGPPRRLGPDAGGWISWSPDGRRVLHTVAIGGKSRGAARAAEGVGADKTILDSSDSYLDSPSDWSPDGRWVALDRWLAGTRGGDIWLVSADTHTAEPLVAGEPNEGGAVFSPDGKLLAYESNEAGPPDVYIRTLKGVGNPRRVSVTGGVCPRWREDGNELYYVSLSGQLTSVPVLRETVADIGPPRVLFKLPIPFQEVGSMNRCRYDISRDGQRFIVAVSEPETPVLTFVQNWAAALRN